MPVIDIFIHSLPLGVGQVVESAGREWITREEAYVAIKGPWGGSNKVSSLLRTLAKS